jgi:hypothetical protein
VYCVAHKLHRVDVTRVSDSLYLRCYDRTPVYRINTSGAHVNRTYGIPLSVPFLCDSACLIISRRRNLSGTFVIAYGTKPSWKQSTVIVLSLSCPLKSTDFSSIFPKTFYGKLLLVYCAQSVQLFLRCS